MGYWELADRNIDTGYAHTTHDSRTMEDDDQVLRSHCHFALLVVVVLLLLHQSLI